MTDESKAKHLRCRFDSPKNLIVYQAPWDGVYEFSGLERVDWTTGVDYWIGLLDWSTGTLEPSSAGAGYALYPCITQPRRTRDSVSTLKKHEEPLLGAWPTIVRMLNGGTTTHLMNHAEIQPRGVSLALEGSVPHDILANHGRRLSSGSDCN